MSQTKAQLIDNLVQPITGALGSASAPTFSFTADPNTGIYSPGADQLAISTGGTGRLFVDSSGRVGVGTASPGKTLDVTGEIRCSSRFQTFGDVISSDWIYVGSSAGARGISSDAISRALLFGINGSEVARFDTSGRLGVGTSSPGAELDVRGGANIGDATSTVRITTDGTNGYISTSTNHPLRIRTNNLSAITIDTSQRVGIGTSSPARNLAVNGGASEGVVQITNNTSGTSAANGLEIIHFTNGETDIHNRPNASLRFSTNNTERVRITGAGNVGIGTTSPGGNSGTRLVLHDASTPRLRLTNSTTGEAASDGAELSLFNSDFIIENRESAPIIFYNGGGERARIDSSGRLLVGTSSGRTVGSVAASIQIEGVTDTGLSVTNNSNGSAGDSTWLTLARTRGTAVGGTTAVSNNDWLGSLDFAGHNGSSFNVGARIIGQVDGAVSGGGVGDMPGRLVFSTTADGASSPTERMRITNDGKALFGGTTSTTAKWNFWDTDSTGMAWLSATTSGNYRRAYLWGSAGSQGLYFTNGNNEANLSSAGAWTNASDARIKKDIEPISYGLAEVMASQPRKYKMIADDQECIGFVAQEMLKIVPEVVSGGETEDRKYCLDYGSLVAVAFKAIQEQQAIIEGLEARLATLESA